MPASAAAAAASRASFVLNEPVRAEPETNRSLVECNMSRDAGGCSVRGAGIISFGALMSRAVQRWTVHCRPNGTPHEPGPAFLRTPPRAPAQHTPGGTPERAAPGARLGLGHTGTAGFDNPVRSESRRRLAGNRVRRGRAPRLAGSAPSEHRLHRRRALPGRHHQTAVGSGSQSPRQRTLSRRGCEAPAALAAGGVAWARVHSFSRSVAEETAAETAAGVRGHSQSFGARSKARCGTADCHRHRRLCTDDTAGRRQPARLPLASREVERLALAYRRLAGDPL